MRIVHYINQFFAGLGGEASAEVEPYAAPAPIGPSLAFNAELKDGVITKTIVCGDNYFASHTKEAVSKLIAILEKEDFDIFIAGPAFQAGRYGFACGTMCNAVKDYFQKPVFTSMHEENPGVEMFKRDIIIFRGGKSAAAMRQDVSAVASHVDRYIQGLSPLGAEEEKYFERGIRHQIYDPQYATAAERGVAMLLAKMKGEKYQTELPVPEKENVPIAEAVKNIAKARIALITTGGIVPVENPDRIQSASATRWGRYNISEMDTLKKGEFKTIHAGFDPAAANEDPNRIMPVDTMKELLHTHKFGSLHAYFYSTVGTGTTEKEARRMAKEMIPYIKEDQVDAVLLVST